jgi:hypothetical protein
MEGIGVVDKICKNKVRWKQRGNPNATAEDLTVILEQTELYKQSLAQIEYTISKVDAENQAMCVTPTYKDYMYFQASDILTPDSLVVHELAHDVKITSHIKQDFFEIELFSASELRYEFVNV